MLTYKANLLNIAHLQRMITMDKESTVILFPGQGHAYIGMCKSLLKYPAVRELFNTANNVLGYDLLKLCLEGPQSELEKTVYCQTATMVTSLATLEKLKEEYPNALENCTNTAGFSLGEITALVFSGVLKFEDGLQLLKVRAENMQIASELNKGSMAMVLYNPEVQLEYACTKAKEWCISNGVANPECCIANFLYPECKVVAGCREALKYIEDNKEQFEISKFTHLPLAGAFHSRYMTCAVEPFRKMLESMVMKDPVMAVHSNIDGRPYRDVKHIKKMLPEQILKPVGWEQTLHHIYETNAGAQTFICGPRNHLGSILKRANPDAFSRCINIEG